MVDEDESFDSRANRQIEVILSANTTNPIVRAVLGEIDSNLSLITVEFGKSEFKYGYLSMGAVNALDDCAGANDLISILLSVDKNGMTREDYEAFPPTVINTIVKRYLAKLKDSSDIIEFFRCDT